MTKIDETLEADACSERFVACNWYWKLCYITCVIFRYHMSVLNTSVNIVKTSKYFTICYVSTALDNFWKQLSLYRDFEIFRQECLSGRKTRTSKGCRAWLVFVGRQRMIISLSIAFFTNLYVWLPWASIVSRTDFSSCVYMFGSNVLSLNLIYSRSSTFKTQTNTLLIYKINVFINSMRTNSNYNIILFFKEANKNIV